MLKVMAWIFICGESKNDDLVLCILVLAPCNHDVHVTEMTTLSLLLYIYHYLPLTLTYTHSNPLISISFLLAEVSIAVSLCWLCLLCQVTLAH